MDGGWFDRVFNEFVAPDYSAQGIQESNAYVQPQALSRRARENHFIPAEPEREIHGIRFTPMELELK